MDIRSLYDIYLEHPVITTDSRACPEGSIFFALKGDRFDGNDYIEQVLSQGVAYAVGDREDLPRDERVIKVKDVLSTLQELAHFHRSRMKVKVIAITGTNGKTTTKELIATALASKYNILYTEGNLNNHIGVPLTLLRLKPEHDYAVIELGANHQGEIRALCKIADPDFGLITNVGKAHLEGFGSFEGIVRTKTELYDFLRERNGIVFGNLDNDVLKNYYSSQHVIYYGTSRGVSVSGRITGKTPALSIEWIKNNRINTLSTHLVGGYNLENILAAICVASHFEVEDDRINEAIGNYIPCNNRSQRQQTSRNLLIVDAYNANPTSMEAALENFIDLPDSPKMVILGEMKELGAYSEEEHAKMVESLRNTAIDRIFLVGESFSAVSPSDDNWKVFSSTNDLIVFLDENPMQGYTVLIKGSRGNQLEKAIPYL